MYCCTLSICTPARACFVTLLVSISPANALQGKTLFPKLAATFVLLNNLFINWLFSIKLLCCV